MSAKITKVTITVSESDLMENIREFVQVEGLTFNTLELINNSIEFTANFHKVIDIPFYARFHIDSVTNNIIRIKIEQIEVIKHELPNPLWSGGLALGLQKVADLGISYEGGYIVLDVDSALQKVPQIHVVVDNITMENGWLDIKLSNIKADVKAMNADQERKD